MYAEVACACVQEICEELNVSVIQQWTAMSFAY